ncbi:MAG: alpha/beta hydrolase [Allosphingosinicella sp.]|uniref:alpha/beta hydrolase n=1 Tax=Allosphingosinicella sp. TaxID=2823234 RepID=UPI00392E61DF
MLKLLLIPLLLYAAVAAAIFFAQTALLFPARLVGQAPAPPGSDAWELATHSGDTLRGIHVAPSAPSGERLLVLGFGGNGWNAAGAAQYLSDLYPEAHVVAFHYRGYGSSDGSPGAAALQADALLVHDLAVERIAPDRTIATGFSIGSGVAAHLAGRRPLDGLVLVTPFDSLTEVAAGQYPWLPVRLLFRHRMEPAADLADARTPVVLIAAEGDQLIPAARTEALARAVPNLAGHHVVPMADHNSIYQHPVFRGLMREAPARLRAAEGRRG